MPALSTTLTEPTLRPVRLALAQMNPLVGDITGNVERILELANQAHAAGADIVAFPELAVAGYPPEDLLLKPGFLRENMRAIRHLASQAPDLICIVGYVDVREDIYNAAAIIQGGGVQGIHRKHFLPNYGVFDENRYFRASRELTVFRSEKLIFGVTICEDIWYPDGPARSLAQWGGAQLIININASPYHVGKWRFREKLLATRASDDHCVLAYVNQVGGQDELVFDGQSLMMDPEGELILRGPAFEEALILADVDLMSVLHTRLRDPRLRQSGSEDQRQPVQEIVLGPIAQREAVRPTQPTLAPPIEDEAEEVYRALILGVRDYVRKNGFQEVVIGLSGGVDSGLVATIAADALGAERVHLVSMPSSFSSPGTQGDARQLAENLGVDFRVIPIEDLRHSYTDTLQESFADSAPDVTEENLQARIRGNLLMALSNKFGWLVLTTGNKSEMACGYATLYGDMAGGFAVIKDVPKTLVYRLCQYRNRDEGVIPRGTIERPPSAELAPDQLDTDSLPPYEELDPIIFAYVEEDQSAEEIAAHGHDPATVERVIRMIDRNEYKRRQAPPGIKITPKAFGRDRRLPITNRFRDLGGLGE